MFPNSGPKLVQLLFLLDYVAGTYLMIPVSTQVSDCNLANMSDPIGEPEQLEMDSFEPQSAEDTAVVKGSILF